MYDAAQTHEMPPPEDQSPPAERNPNMAQKSIAAINQNHSVKPTLPERLWTFTAWDSYAAEAQASFYVIVRAETPNEARQVADDRMGPGCEVRDLIHPRVA